jgi:Adaptin N terminal region/Adaptin C-terminal domain
MDKKASKFVKAAKSSLNKAKRTYICRSLKDVIKAYRACTTSAEERALVKKESAHIRDLFREGDTAFRRINITKLLFFHMNGYLTDFGMTECIKLCASSKFADKRVAYLGLMIIVDETEDILMLITNCLKQDLASQDPHVVALALTVLGNMASAEMVRDLLPEIEKHLLSSDVYLRKKASLAAVRAVRKLPNEETANILVTMPRIFESRSSGAHIAGTALAISLACQHRTNLVELRRSTFPAALAVLRDLLVPANRSKDRGTAISGMRNSFTQIKLLTVLRYLAGNDSFDGIDDLLDVLAQVASKTDSTKLIGTAVLYECVRTILAIHADDDLHRLALTVLGQFLSHKDANVRYVALQELVKAVGMGKHGIAIEKYQEKILECLQEPDPTIRKRAVELLRAIACPSNVLKISEDLLSFLANSEEEDLRELACRRIIDMANSFAPSKEWHVDTFLRALDIVDMSMPDSLVSEFLAMVSSELTIQAYAARLAYERVLCVTRVSSNVLDPFDVSSLGQFTSNSIGERKSNSFDRIEKRKPRLELVAVCIFGEYGDLLVTPSPEAGDSQSMPANDAISCIERILGASEVDSSTLSGTSLQADSRDDAFSLEVTLVREASMSALVKLAGRLSHKLGTGRTPAALLGQGAMQNLDHPVKNGPPAMSSVVQGAGTGKINGLGTDLLAGLGITDNLAVLPKNSDYTVQPFQVGQSMSSVDVNGETDLMMDGENPKIHPIVLRVRQNLSHYRKSKDLETQQRACEYSLLLTGRMESICTSTLCRMPPVDYHAIRDRTAGILADGDRIGGVNERQAPFSDSLLSLLDDDGSSSKPSKLALQGGGQVLSLPAPFLDSSASSSAVGERTWPKLPDSSPNCGSSLGEMEKPSICPAPLSQDGFRANSGNSDFPSNDQAAPNAAIMPCHESSEGDRKAVTAATSEANAVESEPVGTVQMLETGSVSISISFYKDSSSDMGKTRAEFMFKNSDSVQLDNFVLQLAVPKYMKAEMKPASSTSISIGGHASQRVILINSLNGIKPVQLRYRIEFQPKCRPDVREQGVVTGLPPDL